MQPVFVTDSH